MHRWSQLFIPTLREAPADAEVASHKFLVRAGYMRQLAAGIYSYLLLGQRSILKISNIVRQEMDTIGQEFYLPALNPREIWEASGRWREMGDNMFRLKDRKGADLCLGMTHEEVMTDIARKELRSYKQLPQIWYQIQTKFRDEPRPKSGLLRVRQFTMKDSYSFDLDAAGLDVSYKKHYDVYCRIFDRCGLKYVVVEAHFGRHGRIAVARVHGAHRGRRGPGGKLREVRLCRQPGEGDLAAGAGPGAARQRRRRPELVHTPGTKTIDEVSAFLGVPVNNNLKSLAYMVLDGAGGSQLWRPLLVLMRGNDQLHEAKLMAALGGREFRPMREDEIVSFFGTPAGYLGPAGLKVAQPVESGGKRAYAGDADAFIVLLDEVLRGRRNMVGGANKENHHLRNLTPEVNFQRTAYADLRSVQEGEGCPKCGHPLKLAKAVEIGHIFKLGYKYSESMGARVLDKDGKEVTPIMGSYGIGIERILTAVIEQNHDENGFWLPPNIAPFQVVVVPTNVADAKLADAAGQLAGELEKAGVEVILDDRDERPGVKFKDADLVGIPFRINVGRKLSDGKVEVITRSTRQSQDVTISEAVRLLSELTRSAR